MNLRVTSSVELRMVCSKSALRRVMRFFADDEALEDHVVLAHEAVVRPAADGVDRLLGQVVLGGGVVLGRDGLADLVIFLFISVRWW